MNINDNDRKDDVETEDGVKTEYHVKAEDGEIKGNVGFRYNGDDYKDLTKRQRFASYKYRLSNWLKNIVSRYLKENDSDVWKLVWS